MVKLNLLRKGAVMPVELGAKVRDTVSGFVGVATCRYEYMNGCVRFEVSAADKDDKPCGFVFDVEQLEVLESSTRSTPAPHGGERSSTPVKR